jgi:hypothetical protein
VVSTSTAHVQELQHQLASWRLEHYLGPLYYRLPHPGEKLGLGVANLARLGGEGAALPEPRVIVEKLDESPGRVTVKLTLVNDSSEGSDLGQVDANFVEAWAVGGAFGDVRQGQFYRYDVFVPAANGQLVRAARFPTVLRLFVPLLPAGARIETGPIEIRTVREGLRDLQVRATFLAPYGGPAEMGATSWVQLQPAPTPTPQSRTSPAGRPTPRPGRPR